MVHKVHMHYSGTSCLCACHFDATAACDDRECIKVVKADAARTLHTIAIVGRSNDSCDISGLVVPTIAFDGAASPGTYSMLATHAIPLPAPVQASAAEPMSGYVTPFGTTSRFGR